MLYDVDQAAIKLNVSKMTIYNKIKLKEYKGKVIKKSGKTYVDDELLNLIKDSLKLKSEVVSNNMGEQTKQEVSTDKEESFNLNQDLYNTLIEQLKIKDKQIEGNALQLKEKDIQISNLNDRLTQEQDLHKNTQILFKQQQPQQDIKALEAHFEEFDNKLIDIKEQMAARKDQQGQKQKGFLSKLFNK